ncbi:MAG: Type IV secretory pathway VirB4 components-like protein [Parcubacteria group bacterium Licking1014_17]|nr:MAG: Type IV secretory pathway VirB4 components-like protein [Parcubacteria group bacterium Licking1014_17]
MNEDQQLSPQISTVPIDSLAGENKSVDELIAPPSITITANYIQMGDTFARTFFIATYPRFLTTGWFSPIINIDISFDASIYIHPQDTGQILKKLRDKLAKLQAQAMEDQAKGKVRDPIIETAIGDIEMLRDKLQQGTDRFFQIGVYITVYAKTQQELNEIEKQLKGMTESQMIYIKPATFRMKEGFNSTLPFNKDELGVLTSLDTEPISSMFPFVSYNLTRDKGIMYGINLHNNSLIIFDRFSLENANSVVFAKSGAGKSYTIKLELLRSLMFGVDEFIIDPENEFKYLCDTVGGTSVKISIASSNHINPFDLPSPRPDESFADVLRSHITVLTGLIRLMLGDLTPQEEAIIDEALTQTYAIRDITYNTKDTTNMAPPMMQDFQSVLEGMTGTESLVVRVRKYTSGTFAGFLNNPTNVLLDNQFIVFSVRDMEEELRPIAMYLVLNFIWTQVRTSLKKRILVVDEAWTLMRHEAGAAFLFGIAKRARKYYLGLTTISQDVPDMLSSTYGKPIITNSSMQILLRQSPASIDLIQQVFNLTDSEKFFLLEAKVGHGLFFVGTGHVAIRVLASYAEDQVITSDPRQLLEIEQAKKDLAGAQ